MSSKEYIDKLARQTGFKPENLQRQLTLLELLKEVGRHPLLRDRFALKGGTAINLFYFPMPRLSVDIDLNYIASPDRDTMLRDRPELEKELAKLIESRGVSVEHAPSEEHAGAKWRLRAPSVFGGKFTLELDLNYMMRIPLWGTNYRKPVSLEGMHDFQFVCVSFEELFAGKIKALLERSAAKDLYDVALLSTSNQTFDSASLRKALILFGVTSKRDWREKDFRTIDRIDEKMLQVELTPFVR